MARRIPKSRLLLPYQRAVINLVGTGLRAGMRANIKALGRAMEMVAEKRSDPPGPGEWISGIALGPAGMRRYRLFRPPGVSHAERRPLLVMLHGCGQDAKSFALSTRMNRVAARERFFVLYPEQLRQANAQGCWNWYDTRSGRAYSEAATLAAMIDQVCLLYPVDRERIAIAGLSAGASMGALLVTRYPGRFKALVMHSGIPPGAAHSPVSAIGAMRGYRTPSAPLALTAWPPLLVIHGVADLVVSANNGRAAAEVWAEAAGASAAAGRRVRRGNRYEMTVTDFKIRGSTIATLCEVDELGHAWSGGDGRHPFGDAQGPDASRMAWAFAARHFDSQRASTVPERRIA